MAYIKKEFTESDFYNISDQIQMPFEINDHIMPEMEGPYPFKETETEQQQNQQQCINRKRKRISYSLISEEPKKRDLEFEDKKIIAEEVSKYPQIFDINHESFSDKSLQHSLWKEIAKATGLSVKKCIAHWTSLKRSAKYFTNQFDVEDGRMYRSDWPFCDIMSFYTPPSVKNGLIKSTRRPKISIESTELEIPTPTHIFKSAAPSPISISTDNCDSMLPENKDEQIYEEIQIPLKPTTKEDLLVEGLTLMANTFAAHLQSKAQTKKSPLKYIEMWTNFDKLVSKLDEDAVDDLNVNIMNLIGEALKKKRGTMSSGFEKEREKRKIKVYKKYGYDYD